jgi:hypothetical protein
VYRVRRPHCSLFVRPRVPYQSYNNLRSNTFQHKIKRSSEKRISQTLCCSIFPSKQVLYYYNATAEWSRCRQRQQHQPEAAVPVPLTVERHDDGCHDDDAVTHHGGISQFAFVATAVAIIVHAPSYHPPPRYTCTSSTGTSTNPASTTSSIARVVARI